MKNYKFYNNIAGWLVFLVAAITYLSTIEPTASFWDCGEFITSAFKLEVGHPPGAPLFMILGHFFSLFSFGNPANVAKVINMLSALASAFTILFLYWSITHIAKRIITKSKELTEGQLIAVIGSGIVGALAYTFSDSFWFSAVEGEVYATSSFFTAIVFWAILKWESQAEQKYANRWLVLIAYLMGLSIGVHLLNLLAIPAIVFIYYFKKYEVTKKGIIYTSLISIGLLLFVMYGIIQGLFVVGSKFELLFTNNFGLPFYTGFLFYMLLIFGGVIFGIYYTFKKNKALLNTAFTMFAVILIGYSSFALILIRSLADTPMNQNKPDDVFSLLGYLNREQYGDRPLAYGQSFNSQIDESDPYPSVGDVYYDKKDENGKDKYVIVDHKIIRNYKSSDKMLFPRLYSDQSSPDHITGYLYWTGHKEGDFFYARTNPETNEPIRNRYGEVQYDRQSQKKLPSFGDNIRYFIDYQLNFMYFRYFMWNFAGKQNDIQGNGNVKDGNWISGIKFIDEMRLGNQDAITKEMKDNKAHNVYFFLPLLLGILGMVFMYSQGKKGIQYFWVVMLFFFFTGVAIVLYLNQPPFQPRERDYAYAGSFYVFAMYIGFGVAFIYKLLKNYTTEVISASVATILSIGVPVLMAQQNWDDHDRSNRYTARDYAKNYLSSCEPNSIIFTNGDNDTFPLWYIQEVEGFRTDVRVINLSYFNTDWYVDQMRKRAYKSAPINFTLKPNQYERGTRDVIYKMENPGIYLQEKYKVNKKQFETAYKLIFDEYLNVLSKSNFVNIFSKEYNSLSLGYNAIDPVQFYSFTQKLNNEKILNDIKIPKSKIEVLNAKVEDLVTRISKSPAPLQTIINHIAQENDVYKAPLQNQEMVNYLPTTNFYLPVDKQKVLKEGIVKQKDSSKIVNGIRWDIRKNHLGKNEMMVLDMLATNNWNRPIYFATTVGNSLYMNLEDYFQLDGLAYKIVPIKAKTKSFGSEGSVNTDVLYDNMMNKFVWGGLEEHHDDIYFDQNNRRFVMNFKSSFKALAEALIKENKFEKAEKVLDKCTSLFSNDITPFNYYDLIFAEQYFKIKKDDKAVNIIKIALDNFEDELNYYASIEDDELLGMQDDVGRLSAVMQEALKTLYQYKQDEVADEYVKRMYSTIEDRFQFNQQMARLNSGQAQQKWYSNLPDFKMGLLQFQMFLSEHIK